VALRTHHGKYVCAEQKDYKAVADRSKVDIWEKWQIITVATVTHHPVHYAPPPAFGGYPPAPSSGYPPQSGGYPPQQGYPQQGYPPPSGGYPPQQGHPTGLNPPGQYPPGHY
jgi:hypothetical protein